MTNLDLLRVELDAGHPVTGAYSIDSAIAADEINAVNRTRDREFLLPSEIVESVVVSEYAALTADKRTEFWGLMGLGQVNPFGKAADLMIHLFGGGSGTITALAALRSPAASRADELGLGNVRPGTIEQARAL